MKNQLYYEQGWFLLLLIIPLIALLFWLYLRNRHATLTVSTIDSLNKRKTTAFLSPPLIMLILRLLALMFIIIGLANIKSIRTVNYTRTVAEADIVLAVDVSKSMLIEDLKPNRVEAVKNILSEFIAGRSRDRIGIVLYAGESIYWCPLTKDYPFLLRKLHEIDENDFLDGTAIGIGLASAVNALQASKNSNKFIILLTDGENNAGFIDPLTAAGIAKRFKIKVYTIGVGKTGIASFPIIDLSGKKTYTPMAVSIDEGVLKNIASATGGIYFSATNNKALQNIYGEIDKLEKKTKSEVVKDVQYHSEFRSYILISMFLLLLETALKFTIFRTWPQ